MNINVRVELSRNLIIILIGLIFTIIVAKVLMNRYQLLIVQSNNITKTNIRRVPHRKP